MTYEDILYDVKNGVATVTINRPKVYNAFRPRTCVEMLDAFMKAGWDTNIGAIVLTGAGGKAFCTAANDIGMPKPNAMPRYACGSARKRLVNG